MTSTRPRRSRTSTSPRRSRSCSPWRRSSCRSRSCKHHPAEGRRMSRASMRRRRVRGAADRPAGRAALAESLLSRGAAMLVMGVFTLYFLMPIWWLFVALDQEPRRSSSAPTRCGSPTSTSFDNIGDAVRLPRRRLPAVDAQQRRSTPALGAARRDPARRRCAATRWRSTGSAGRELLFNVVLGGVLVPATALALPLFLLFSQVQLDQHVLGGVPARASSARSASTSPASSPRRACPTSCSRRPASTAPARCARSSRCRSGSCSRRSSRSSCSSSSPSGTTSSCR